MGLFDSLADPEQQGLLGAASGLLGAGGPSRMPVSLGQALGAGFQGGIQGYKGAQDRQKEQAALDLQQAQLQQALRQGQINSELYARVLSGLQGGQGSPAPSGAPDQSDGAPAIGAPSQTGGQQTSGQGSFGLNSNGILGGLLAGPGELGKAIVAANSPTDLTKAMQQAHIDPDSALGREIGQKAIAKQINIPLVAGRTGAPMYNQQGEIVAMAPKVPDNAIPQIVNGQVVGVSALPGAAGVEQTNAYAGAAGKAQAEPIAGVDAAGNPTFTNKLTAAGGAPAPANNPPGAIPWTGSGPISPDRLAQARAAAAALPVDGTVRPAAAPGFNASQDKLAGASADRYNELLQQANDSPARVNVYDNILGLSKSGVQTGNTTQWQNNVKSALVSTPGIGKLFPGMKDDVSNYQELSKFMYQNAQRNWQAAGGTGTNAQLDQYSKSSPNDVLEPQALQAIAQFGKAGEIALQAKTNAAQQFKDQNNGNVVNLDQFDRAWRNNFDPVIFQIRALPEDQQDAYVANLKKTNPKEYQNMVLKSMALKNMGGL